MSQKLVMADHVMLGRVEDGELGHGGAVLVEDGVIVSVGPRALDAAAEATVLEFSGGTLLPGLVNAHVHLVFDASPDPVNAFLAATHDDLLAGIASRAGQALRAGVTTLRDLGDDGHVFAIRDQIEAGLLPGPRILAAGPPITVEGGHCWFFGGMVDGSPASLRAAVEDTVAAGADVIKVMAGGGKTTPGGADMWESQFDAGQLRIITSTAHALGRRVAAHAHGVEAITASVRAGVDTIEHCTWLSGPEYRDDRREEVAEQMAAEGISACVALNQDWLPFAERLGPDRGPRQLERIRWLDSLGVPLAVGTDAGLPGSVFDDLVGALELYPYLGFSNARTIEIATSGSAVALGLEKTTGRIAPGLAADLLVVDGNPLEDLGALRSRRLVMARGEVIMHAAM